MIGGTGSGKSTLASLALRFYDVTGGEVKVGGNDVRDLTRHTLRRQVSLVEQGATLFSGTIASNLRWGDSRADEKDLAAAVETAQATGVVSVSGTGTAVVCDAGACEAGVGEVPEAFVVAGVAADRAEETCMVAAALMSLCGGKVPAAVSVPAREVAYSVAVVSRERPGTESGVCCCSCRAAQPQRRSVGRKSFPFIVLNSYP